MLLADHEIRKLCQCETYHKGSPMIEPFSEAVSGDGVISYGLTHAGYDAVLDNEFRVYKDGYEPIDPLRFKEPGYEDKVLRRLWIKDGDIFELTPHDYVLASTREYFRMPPHLEGRCLGKSTYARCGLIVNTTPLEPGWEGNLTLEISNPTKKSIFLRPGQGIAQIQFGRLSATPEKNYADKKGKYQGQTGVTPARVE